MKKILLATVALTALSIAAPALAADMAPAYKAAPDGPGSGLQLDRLLHRR